MNKNIIAIQGNKASGKDETAKYLNYILNTPSWMHNYIIGKIVNFYPIFHKWKITRYASNLKKILAILMNVDVKKFEDREFKENYYFNFNEYCLVHIKDNPFINTIQDKYFVKELKRNNLNIALEYTLSIRQILQFFGTEIMRKFFGNELWINSTLNSKYNNLIIADQRFEIENKILSNSNFKTLIIHIIRKDCVVGAHSSEKELENLLNNKKYDILLENNGTLKDLFNKCKEITYYYLT